ncbi:hypothetical protein NUW58_g4068 [Xylaria curta]|uniref:Uncharacterized protein n=1 Tax=Xylaria curta TaxID=42375 RepID=A0ACC1P9D4_9PEZI|nr:hypothetical protein NUW58_g4068 [Xylaria curta]
MAVDPLPATLSFLTDAAHLLALASPETSAHLMSQRNSLMFHNELDQPDVQRQHVCGCCGHIMIAGLGDVLTLQSGKSTRKRRPSSKKQKAETAPSRSGCRKTLTCNMCGRYTNINFPPPARISKRRAKQTARPTMVASTADATVATSASARSTAASPSETTKTSANASSKKRAKNRKQGLQALLQQSSNSKSQAGLGLSLADFMQN